LWGKDVSPEKGGERVQMGVRKGPSPRPRFSVKSLGRGGKTERETRGLSRLQKKFSQGGGERGLLGRTRLQKGGGGKDWGVDGKEKEFSCISAFKGVDGHGSVSLWGGGIS